MSTAMPAKGRSRTLVSAVSGHTLCVSPITRDELPTNINREEANNYGKFWVVKNWDEEGVALLYLGKGYTHPSAQYKHDRSAHDPNEYVVWYRNGKLYSGRGDTMQEAIERAQKAGWLYAE